MKINLSSLLTTFESLPSIIKTYVANIPDEKLDLKRNDEAWTIREHIYHIGGVQEMLLGRIKKCATEANPVITPFFPESEEGELFTSLEESLSHYKKLRDEQVNFINGLNHTQLNHEALHGEYSQYNIPIILNHMVFHEYWHMYRLEEIWLTKDDFFK